MKVLYGVQGTGNGHLARARALVPALREHGINPDIVLSGRPESEFFNMEVFGEFRCFQGLSLIVERGQMQTLQTVYKSNLLQLRRDIKNLDLEPYDLIITDFEPVTAWAAKLKGRRSVGISHQCAFDYQVPKQAGHFGARMVMRTLAPSQTRVGLHWHHFGQPILPPIVERMQATATIENKIVVYMGFEDLDDVIRFLTPFTDFEFHVFAKIQSPIQSGNVVLKPLSHGEFHRDLQDCAGVISNAGFELASECLTLGKKLLIRPLAGQYEQLCNALALQQLKRATVMACLQQDVLAQWLLLPSPDAINYPDVSAHLARWISEGCTEPLAQLAEGVWRNVDMSLQLTSPMASPLSSSKVN